MTINKTTPLGVKPPRHLTPAEQRAWDEGIAIARAEAGAPPGWIARRYAAGDVQGLRGQTWMSVVRDALREVDRLPGADPLEVLRQYLSLGGLDQLDSVVNAALLYGAESAVPTCAGFIRRGNLQTFLETQLGRQTTASRLGRVAKGDSAEGIQVGVDTEAHQLARYGAAFELDEQDIVSNRPIDPVLVALEEIGRAGSRLLPDLVYAVLLANEALSDGTAAFHSDRSNLGSAALSDIALDAAMAAIAGQVLTSGDGVPVHRGLAPAILIVPPALYGPALRLNADMQAGLTVLPESRISATGVLDPRDGETLRVGSATNWLLAASERQCPSVVVSGLNGQFSPQVRGWEFDRGGWGRGYDIKLDLAATILDPTGLYFSTGAGA